MLEDLCLECGSVAWGVHPSGGRLGAMCCKVSRRGVCEGERHSVSEAILGVVSSR